MHPQMGVMLWRKNVRRNDKKLKRLACLPAFYGVKAGMTRIFDESGKHVPVTVIKLIPNVVSQVKTTDKDGYKLIKLLIMKKEKSLLTNQLKVTLKKQVLIKL